MTPYIYPGLQNTAKLLHSSDYQAIISAVERTTGITYDQMKGKERHREISEARHIAMSLLWHHFEGFTTLKCIGTMFNRDHSTVIHARKNVAMLTDSCKIFSAKYFNVFNDIRYEKNNTVLP